MNSTIAMTRRSFLKNASVSGATVALGKLL
jgi:hypothetical protein